MNDIITINVIICTRCDKKQYPLLDRETGQVTNRKGCISCNSPYYLKPRKRQDITKARKVQQPT